MLDINQIIKVTGGKPFNAAGAEGFRGLSTDTRSIREGEIFLAIRGENFDGHDFIPEAVNKGARCIIAEDFDPPVLKGAAGIKVANTVKAFAAIASSHRKKFDIPVIAVTGSNGKTTAKEMIAWVLSAKFRVLSNEGTKNNHIGVPATLLRLDESHQIAVLELGTNHFGEIRYLADMVMPDAAAITNIGESHLEYFRDLAGVYKEKSSLYRRSPVGIVLLNNDDRFLRKDIREKRLRRGGQFVLGFGVKGRTDFCADGVNVKGAKVGFSCRRHRYSLNTPGACNVYNALMAIAFGRMFAMSHSEISARLSDFRFPKGRLNLVKFRDTRFIDDTYNSNPFSMAQALKTLADFKAKGRKILVMGDMLELGKDAALLHKKAGQGAAKVCDAMIAVGRLSVIAADAARAGGLSGKNLFVCDSSAEAASVLFKKLAAGPDDIILIKGSRSMKMEEVLRTNVI